MSIVEELRSKVFQQDSDFLARFANDWSEINHNILNDYAQKGYECSFLSILTEKIHSRLPNYVIVPSFGLKGLPYYSAEERIENVLEKPLAAIRKDFCEQYSEYKCKSNQCFDGAYSSSEVDGIIMRDKEFCLLEYEESRAGLCNNFLKFYRLGKLLDRPFESLFVTRLTTRKVEGSPTFDSFNSHIDRLKPMLDTLLCKWKILEIVDLYWEKPKFVWKQ